MVAKKVLFVATSHDQLGNSGTKTGTWAEEVAAPYYTFKDAGIDVTIASVKGGKVPIDDASLQGDFLTPAAKRLLDDPVAKGAVEDSVALDAVDGKDYDAIYLPGGHGVMFDLPGNAKLATLVSDYYAQGKIVSAVCHGPAGLVDAKQPNGKPLVDGKRVTGFLNSEEEAVGKTKLVPFLLEDKLKQLGGQFSCGPDWSVYTVEDGNLITGQNPQSSAKVAQIVLQQLK